MLEPNCSPLSERWTFEPEHPTLPSCCLVWFLVFGLLAFVLFIYYLFIGVCFGFVSLHFYSVYKNRSFATWGNLNPRLCKTDGILLCFLSPRPGASPAPPPSTALCCLPVRVLSIWTWFWSLPIVGRNLFPIGEEVSGRKWESGGWGCELWTQGRGNLQRLNSVEFKGSFCPLCPRWKGFFMGLSKLKQKESELCPKVLAFSWSWVTNSFQNTSSFLAQWGLCPAHGVSSSLTLLHARLAVGLTNIY